MLSARASPETVPIGEADSMTRRSRVCVFGNSTGFRMRPPRKAPEDRTYSEILLQNGYEVRNVSMAGVTLDEAFAYLDDDVVTWFPDAVIVQFGVVEVCLRQTHRGLTNLAIRNYYRNRVFASPYDFPTSLQRLGVFVVRAINGITRRLCALLGLKWQWLPLGKYLRVMEDTIEVVLKETPADVLVLAINPCSDRIERILAGSADQIGAANQAMRTLCAKWANRVRFIDVPLLLSRERLEVCVPDGIHLSALGHRLVGERLLSELLALEQKRDQHVGPSPQGPSDSPGHVAPAALP